MEHIMVAYRECGRVKFKHFHAFTPSELEGKLNAWVDEAWANRDISNGAALEISSITFMGPS